MCAAGRGGAAFAPVTEALRGLTHDLEEAELEAVAGPARQELGRLLPDLAWSGQAAAGAEVVGSSQERLFELLLGVVQRLATRALLLWVVEDLHWADRFTRDLLAYLAATLRSGRVMVVLTFRSDELHRQAGAGRFHRPGQWGVPSTCHTGRSLAAPDGHSRSLGSR